MNKLKCTLEVKYNKEKLYYADQWYLLVNGVYLEPLNREQGNGVIFYRIKGGRTHYYYSKMKKNVKKCNIELPIQMPF